MRTALVLSTVLHVALFLIAVFGLPRSTERLAMMPDAIPVEVVDIGALTNTRVDDRKEPPKPAPPKPQPTPPRTQPPPPPPQAQAQAEPPPPVKTPDPPKQVAEAKPEPPKPEPPEEKPAPKKEEPKPEPPKPEPKKEEKKPEPKKEEPKKEEPKKEPPKKEPPKKEPEKKEPERSFDSVLKNLEKLKDNTPAPPTPEKTETEVAETPQSLAPSKSDRLTISEEDAVRRAISQCWFVDAGAKDAHNQRVEIRVWMNPDRTVRDARIERSTADRATTDRALRAVLNPRCQPLPLPAEQYDRWKVIVFNFDPRDMF